MDVSHGRELAEGRSRWMASRWGQNVRAMQVRIRSRFRVAMTARGRLILRRKPRGPGLVSVRATGFVVPRVFQGNVVLARMARNLAKQEWQKRVSSALPVAVSPSFVSSRFWALLGYSAAGGALVATEQQHQPPQAQALVLTPPPVGSASGSGYQELVAPAKKEAKKSKAAYYEGMLMFLKNLNFSVCSVHMTGSFMVEGRFL